MRAAMDYKKELVVLTKDLPDNAIKELIDFAHFLKVKREGFSYTDVPDSAQYVRNLRVKEGKRAKSGKKFVDDLIAWQKSNS